jgi:hypothetical protein
VGAGRSAYGSNGMRMACEARRGGMRLRVGWRSGVARGGRGQVRDSSPCNVLPPVRLFGRLGAMATARSLFPRILAKTLLASYGIFLMLGGCTWSPSGPDKGDAGSDAAPEREHCTFKAQACGNDCFKSDEGSKCYDCCKRNAVSCDLGGSYSFYSCPYEE